ncbi:Uncharacterised protein [Mycobacterium tuberculosis]|nr:Uncharacterised protein [Mycobacterium tuberculosis]CNT77474.1 Uncharacterised protein [Mycobacterium tuberculosis]CNV66065.1 Uncharacterised protein [Mycobacterium tuberculosis]CNZ73211.1 Uncharacterised protein [Mycobacterium tuberculosis]COW06937.1 Uncharacterised protein [Mycobacterium tuberculosis]
MFDSRPATVHLKEVGALPTARYSGSCRPEPPPHNRCRLRGYRRLHDRCQHRSPYTSATFRVGGTVAPRGHPDARLRAGCRGRRVRRAGLPGPPGAFGFAVRRRDRRGDGHATTAHRHIGAQQRLSPSRGHRSRGGRCGNPRRRPLRTGTGRRTPEVRIRRRRHYLRFRGNTGGAAHRIGAPDPCAAGRGARRLRRAALPGARRSGLTGGTAEGPGPPASGRQRDRGAAAGRTHRRHCRPGRDQPQPRRHPGPVHPLRRRRPGRPDRRGTSRGRRSLRSH